MPDLFETENGILKAYNGSGPEVVIPEGIYTIGEGVFKGMSWLTRVEIPSTVRGIGAHAFKGCRQLREINFPDGLTEIGEYAFHRCHGIEEMIFPKSLTKVDSYAFLYCDGVKKVVLEGPEKIGRAVFSHNLSLREISLNKNIDDSNFSDEVFEGCIHLKKIVLSGEVFEIDNLIEAMDSHAAHPDVIKSIARSVYHSLQIEDGELTSFNINLKKFTVPEGITVIGKSCFYDKKGIISISLPETLREIRANAFLNCISLEEVIIQNEDFSLDPKAFRGCSNLKRINMSGREYNLDEVSDNDTVNAIRDQVLGDFYISGRTLVRYMGNEEQIQILDEVEIIGERCFFGNERLKTVICSKNLREIREEAFEGCLTLQTIILPDGLKRIEREAFAECKKLLKCNIPDSLEFIGEYAFRRCFTLPSFDPWPTHADIHPYAFYKSENFSQADVKPQRRKSDTAVSVNPGEERIAKYANAGRTDIEEVTIDSPECVIEKGAYSNCPNLKRINLNVCEIGEGAFSYCRNLEEVKITGVKHLSAEAFAGCYRLKKFVTEGLEEIGSRCFDECTGLESFDLSGVKSISERAFERCDSLKSISLGKIQVGYHAFADCSSLEHVSFSDDTVLKSGAFTGCTRMHTVTYDGKVYEFGRFSDSLNRVGNPYPGPVRELISSVYTCFEIIDRKKLTAYLQDASGITIPGDIEEIGQEVFKDHLRLMQIDIPESVRVFGSRAFAQTAWISELRDKEETVIINGILLDGSYCKGDVEIPAGVKRIASWSFGGNIDITSITIPSDRIAIESLAFRNCINLKKITDHTGKTYELESVADLINADYPEQIKKIFSECINCFKLDEENNLIESTGNITRLTFPEGIKSVGEGVYKDCHLLEEISLSECTESIGKSAFENSKWLRAVTKAYAVRSIGALAFSGCQSLESIDLSESLCEIGSRCFEHCVSLQDINLSGAIERIPERAFFRCKSLKTIYIPMSVKEIETESFAFCDSLTDAYIPEDTIISDKAFAYCDHLQIHRYNKDDKVRPE